jgi:hypothetical protein
MVRKWCAHARAWLAPDVASLAEGLATPNSYPEGDQVASESATNSWLVLYM